MASKPQGKPTPKAPPVQIPPNPMNAMLGGPTPAGAPPTPPPRPKTKGSKKGKDFGFTK